MRRVCGVCVCVGGGGVTHAGEEWRQLSEAERSDYGMKALEYQQQQRIGRAKSEVEAASRHRGYNVMAQSHSSSPNGAH